MPKLCTFENCRNRACYGFYYGKPERCKTHKENRKSQYSICLCGKAQPVFSFPGETKAICCSQCKKDGMIDIVHKRCPNCIDWKDSQLGNKKYKGYCTRCFEQLFPNDPLTFQIRTNIDEIKVRNYINTIFDGSREKAV